MRLSAARAQNVFFAMQDAVKGDAELSSCLERYFVVAGRGPVEPADGSPVWQSQRSKVETERNRRVVLKDPCTGFTRKRQHGAHCERTTMTTWEELAETIRRVTGRAAAGAQHLEKEMVEATKRVAILSNASDRDWRPGADGIDVARVNKLVSAGKLAELSLREQKYVARSFLDYPAARVEALLEARPTLARTYVRSMLAHWDQSLGEPARWGAYASLVGRLSSAREVVGGPVSAARLVSSVGPQLAARAAQARDLPALFSKLTQEWRYSGQWSATHFALVEWLRGGRPGSAAATAAVTALCVETSQEELRGLLLPTTRGRADLERGPRGSVLARRHAVAHLLAARFGSPPYLTAEAFAEIRTASPARQLR